MSESALAMWTIYRFPLDYPEGYVVTEWHVQQGEVERVRATAYRCDTLHQARTYILGVAGPLACLDRNPGDEPEIVETWV